MPAVPLVAMPVVQTPVVEAVAAASSALKTTVSAAALPATAYQLGKSISNLSVHLSVFYIVFLLHVVARAKVNRKFINIRW